MSDALRELYARMADVIVRYGGAPPKSSDSAGRGHASQYFHRTSPIRHAASVNERRRCPSCGARRHEHQRDG